MNAVDVVIPCYNYARFLPQCVRSVLTQEGVDVRVLIIDDCSGDDSETVGLYLASSDRRVEFRRHSKNRGHIATYNEGLLEWASAEYSLLLSADDALAPGALDRATRIMEQHREVGMTYGMALVINDDYSHDLASEFISEEYRVVSSSEFLKNSFLNGNAVSTPTAVVRTKLQQRLGGYRADLPHSGDMEMWMRFAVHAPVGVLRTVQAYYRMHGGNMGYQYYNQLLGDHREVIQACELILTQWGMHFSDSSLWKEMMLQRISKNACWLASSAFDNGDTKGYLTCFKFAEQVFPKIRGSKIWWFLRIKGFLGQTVWQIMRPTWKRLRRIVKPGSNSQMPTSQLFGWWPEYPAS